METRVRWILLLLLALVVTLLGVNQDLIRFRLFLDANFRRAN